MFIVRPTSEVQLEVLRLLSSRASQRQIQSAPDRRRSSAYLGPFVDHALSEGMALGQRGPWRLGWQRRVWSTPPERSPQVVRGRYRLAVPTVAGALEIRAMLNWYAIPEPSTPDRRMSVRGRPPRGDRRCRSEPPLSPPLT